MQLCILECRRTLKTDSIDIDIDVEIPIPTPGVTLFVGLHASGKSILSYMVYHGLGGDTRYKDTIGSCNIVGSQMRNPSIHLYMPTERGSIREFIMLNTYFENLFGKINTVNDLKDLLTGIQNDGNKLLSRLRDIEATRRYVVLQYKLHDSIKRFLSRYVALIQQLRLIDSTEELGETIAGIRSILKVTLISHYLDVLADLLGKKPIVEKVLAEATSLIEDTIGDVLESIGVSRDEATVVLPIRFTRTTGLYPEFIVYDERFDSAIPIEKSSAGVSAALVLYGAVVSLAYRLMGEDVVYFVEDVEENAHPIAQFVLGAVLHKLASMGVTVLATSHSEFVLAGLLGDNTRVYITSLEKTDKGYSIVAREWKPGSPIPGFFRDTAAIVHELARRIISSKRQ